MVITLILCIILFLIFNYIIVNKINVDWKTLFKRGFPKHDDFFGLYCYEAPQGEGKTYSAVKFTLDMFVEYDYRIITNLKSFVEQNPDIKNMLYIEDIFELIDYCKEHQEERKIILFDEIFTVLQKNVKNPRMNEILSFLAQLRKRSIIFVTTAQNWSEIPKDFRDFCRYKVHCHMFNLPLINRAFLFNHMYDGYNVKWSDELQDFEGPLLSSKFSKANIQIAQSYDTFETIKSNYFRSKERS